VLVESLATYWVPVGAQARSRAIAGDLLGAPDHHAGRWGDPPGSGQGPPCGGTAWRWHLPLLLSRRPTPWLAERYSVPVMVLQVPGSSP